MTLTSSIHKWLSWLHFHTQEYNNKTKMKLFSFFPFKCPWNRNWPCRKIGQGQPRVMIYFNFVVLHTLMLYAKFHGNWHSGSGEEDFFKVLSIFKHGGYLGHVTWIIYTNFRSPFPRRLHIKFGFDWPSGFWGKQVLNFVCKWPRAKVKKWPWPTILTYLHYLNQLKVKGCQSSEKSVVFTFSYRKA